MPIEIREVIIKTRVEENTSKNASPSNPSPTGGKGAASTDAQEIIDKVMDILKSKKER